MDSTKFDQLARGLSSATTRRTAMKGLAAGILGLGVARGVSAQVAPAGCNPQRCKKGQLGDKCNKNGNCCKGLECKSNGKCDFKGGSGGSGDFCKKDKDCKNGFFCLKDKDTCVPDSCK